MGPRRRHGARHRVPGVRRIYRGRSAKPEAHMSPRARMSAPPDRLPTTRARMAALLALVRDEGPITYVDIAQRLSLSRRSTWRDLAAFAAVGLVTSSAHGWRMARPGETIVHPRNAPPRACCECPNDAAPDRSRCERHLALLRERYGRTKEERTAKREARRAERRAAGMCRYGACPRRGETAPNGRRRVYCAIHAAQTRASCHKRMKRQREERMRRKVGLT